MLRSVLLAFMRVHVLHHASTERIFGVGMMEELARHGYKVSPGTLYPLMHRLEADGLLTCESEVVAGKARRYYSITPSGRTALEEIRPKILELVREALPNDAFSATPNKSRSRSRRSR